MRQENGKEVGNTAHRGQLTKNLLQRDARHGSERAVQETALSALLSERSPFPLLAVKSPLFPLRWLAPCGDVPRDRSPK